MKSYNSQSTVSDESIELALPANPAYVSAARLTASSIANRMGYDIEMIEDIKTAVSEACTFLIKKSAQTGIGSFKIVFKLSKDLLEITLAAKKGENLPFNDDDDKLGIMMITALMDDVVFRTDDGMYIDMIKKLKNQVT